MLKAGQYSLPTKLAYMTLNGFSEKDTLALTYLEADVLKLQDILKYPLNSSFINPISNTDPVTGGRPKDDVQTTSGEESEDKRDRSKG